MSRHSLFPDARLGLTLGWVLPTRAKQNKPWKYSGWALVKPMSSKASEGPLREAVQKTSPKDYGDDGGHWGEAQREGEVILAHLALPSDLVQAHPSFILLLEN